MIVAVSTAAVPLHEFGLLTVTTGETAAVTVPLAVALHVAAFVTVTVYVPVTRVVILAVVAPVFQR